MEVRSSNASKASPTQTTKTHNNKPSHDGMVIIGRTTHDPQSRAIAIAYTVGTTPQIRRARRPAILSHNKGSHFCEWNDICATTKRYEERDLGHPRSQFVIHMSLYIHLYGANVAAERTVVVDTSCPPPLHSAAFDCESEHSVEKHCWTMRLV